MELKITPIKLTGESTTNILISDSHHKHLCVKKEMIKVQGAGINHTNILQLSLTVIKMANG